MESTRTNINLEYDVGHLSAPRDIALFRVNLNTVGLIIDQGIACFVSQHTLYGPLEPAFKRNITR